MLPLKSWGNKLIFGKLLKNGREYCKIKEKGFFQGEYGVSSFVGGAGGGIRFGDLFDEIYAQ